MCGGLGARRGAEEGPAYPSTRLIVLQVHEHPALLFRSLGKVLLPFPGVHKLLSEAVAIFHVVPTATPQPVPGKVLGPCCPAAATRGELALPASPADGVHHPGCADCVGKGRLTAPCKRMKKGGKEGRFSSGSCPSLLPPPDPTSALAVTPQEGKQCQDRAPPFPWL